MTGQLRATIAALPVAPGVYRFRDGAGRVLYIGRATQLRGRVASYWGDLRDRRHLRRMVPQIARIEAVACDSVHEAAWLERNLLERAKPRWNRIRGGTEVPVYIRLHEVAGTPRLVLAHWPLPPLAPARPEGEAPPGPARPDGEVRPQRPRPDGEPLPGPARSDGEARPGRPGPDSEPLPGAGKIFGPYLGGARGRLAVSALDRLFPLRYTGDRLDGGLRDLARIRGVARTDRAAFIDTIAAVLGGDIGAARGVREMLEAHRDRAAGNLAFELAARIQEEIEAMEWIVAEQKVTRLVPTPDHDVHGWSDGLLVRFRMRKGRLDGWEQRPSSYAAARRHLELTPAEWVAFAGRNAALARRLLTP
ncbi:GIY-YIG nuclease family protein [Actinoplanes sp. CA-030573]|uniref:GIY-YIG nuclease family protein n=1 Tax=Actinoplanes sp. CA-030573 TaxID=3239898 RepID=UPI003D929E92